MERTVTVSAPQALLDTCLKIVRTLHDVRPWLRPAPLTMTSITNECLALRDLLWQTLSLDRSIDGLLDDGPHSLRTVEALILGCSMTVSVIDEYAMELYAPIEVGTLKSTSPAPTSYVQLWWKEDDMAELLSQIRDYRARLGDLLKTTEPPRKLAAVGATGEGAAASQAAVVNLLHRSQSRFLMRSTLSRSSLRESVVSIDPSPPYALSFHGDENEMEAHFPRGETAPSHTASAQDVVELMDQLIVRDAHRNAHDTEILTTLVRSAAEMRYSHDELKAFIYTSDSRDEPQPQLQRDPRLKNSSSTQDKTETRQNLFKRALKGLASKNTTDLERIESMLTELLDDVETLRSTQESSVAHKTTHLQHQDDAALNSSRAIESRVDKGYEAQGRNKSLPAIPELIRAFGL